MRSAFYRLGTYLRKTGAGLSISETIPLFLLFTLNHELCKSCGGWVICTCLAPTSSSRFVAQPGLLSKLQPSIQPTIQPTNHPAVWFYKTVCFANSIHLVMRLAILASLVFAATAIKRKSDEAGVTKITTFFKPDHPRQDKKPKIDLDVVCPSSNCQGEMKEATSHSRDNPDRVYEKCNLCGAFRWKGRENYCNQNGEWIWLEENPHPNPLDAEIAAENKTLRINENNKLLADIEEWKTNGQWEKLGASTRTRLTELEYNIRHTDPAW